MKIEKQSILSKMPSTKFFNKSSKKILTNQFSNYSRMNSLGMKHTLINQTSVGQSSFTQKSPFKVSNNQIITSKISLSKQPNVSK